MSSNQLGSFSVVDRSVAALKSFYTGGGVNQELFMPIARGASPRTRAFVVRVTPVSANFGQTAVYTIDNSGDYIEEIFLELNLSAITGAVNPSYKNDISTIIDSIRLFQGGTQVEEVWRYDKGTLCNQAFQTFETYQAKTFTEGVQPLAARQAAAVAAQQFEVEIPSLLDFLSIPVSLLEGNSLRLEITFKPLANCVQFTAGTPAASILSANLRCHYIYADIKIMEKILAASKQSPVLFPFLDYGFTTRDIGAGSTSFRHLLSEFKGPVSFMSFMLRETRQVDDTTGNPAFEISNTYPVTDWNLEDKGVLVANTPDNQPFLYNRGVVRVHEFKAYSDPATFGQEYIVSHPFGVESWRIIQNEDVTARGYYDFSMTQSANLTLTFPANAVPIRLSAFQWAFNAMLLSNGQLTRFYS